MGEAVMSVGQDICVNEYILQQGDYLRIFKPDTGNYFTVQVQKILENSDEKQRVQFLTLKTEAGYSAGMVLDTTFNKNAPEHEKVRATVWPKDTKELEVPDFLQSSLEERVLHKIMEFLQPFTLRNKGVYEKVVRAHLINENVLPASTTDKDMREIIGRALNLVPGRFMRKSGWIKLEHRLVANKDAVTPVSSITTAKVVDKRMLTEGIIKIIESGILGPIEWKK